MNEQGILYVYGRPDTSTFRYRVLHMVEAARTAGIDASWATVQSLAELPLNERRVRYASSRAIVFARCRMSPQLSFIIDEARRFGCRIVGDLDDLVHSPDVIPEIMEGVGAPLTEDRLDYWYAYTSRLEATLRRCDALTATTQALAQRLQRHFERPAFVVENFASDREIRRSESLVAGQSQGSRDALTVGYFSGTPTHGPDLDVALQALLGFLRHDEQRRLLLVGPLDLPSALWGFSDQIEILPLLDETKYWNAMLLADIHVAPLRSTPFTDCKSALKFFEGALLGRSVIASPSSAFRKAVVHGSNGWLATDADWERVLEEAAHERMYTNDVGVRAREWALVNAAPAHHGPSIRRFIERL